MYILYFGNCLIFIWKFWGILFFLYSQLLFRYFITFLFIYFVCILLFYDKVFVPSLFTHVYAILYLCFYFLFFQILYPILYTLIVYFMTGQPLSFHRYCMFTLMCIMISFVAQSLALVIGAAMEIQVMFTTLTLSYVQCSS